MRIQPVARSALAARVWVGFGNGGVIADNDPVEQERTAKFSALLSNAVISNARDIAETVRQLQAEGMDIAPEDLAQVSPYLTEHIRRPTEYSTHELGDEPDAYAALNVDFTALRGDEPTTEDFRRPRETVSRLGARRIAAPPGRA